MWSFLALFISSSLILFRLNSNTSTDKLTNKGIANQKNLTPFSIKKSIENENKKSRNKSLSYNKEILNPNRSVAINSQNTITQKDFKKIQKDTKTKKGFAVTLHSKTINIFNQKINQPKKIVFVKIPQLKNLVSSNKTAYKKGWEYGI